MIVILFYLGKGQVTSPSLTQQFVTPHLSPQSVSDRVQYFVRARAGQNIACCQGGVVMTYDRSDFIWR